MLIELSQPAGLNPLEGRQTTVSHCLDCDGMVLALLCPVQPSA